MMSEPYYICETCREPVEDGDEDVVRAVKMVEIESMQVGREWLEGLGVHFHRACFPYGSPYYKLKS
jgi:hypothetical protein